jgi:5'-nucleotidase/UDP-sugar diphosphatase
VRDVRIGGQPLDPNRTDTVAITDYQLSGADGYGMFEEGRVLVGPESGDLIVTVLETYVTASRELAPAIEGRIVISR